MNNQLQQKAIRKRNSCYFIVLCVFAALGGCSGLPYIPVETSSPVLRLGPGDQVEIKFAYAEQFNELQAVRPDGKIELMLVGEVQAEGKTPDALRKELTRTYEAYLKHPELAVIVRFCPVYVIGEVMQPGQLVELTGRMTALEAIMHAGGFNLDRAKPESVVLIRHIGGTRYSYRLDLKKALKTKESEPFYLQPRDIIYVPRTRIVNVDVWVDQHIRRLIPIGLGAGLSAGG